LVTVAAFIIGGIFGASFVAMLQLGKAGE